MGLDTMSLSNFLEKMLPAKDKKTRNDSHESDKHQKYTVPMRQMAATFLI